MKITEVNLKGFRNFYDATVRLENKTLIIGANDVGKTNFLYSLRLLLDRTLSEAEIEPRDSDFYAYEEGVNRFSITLKFEACADNVRARFRENISEEGTLYLKYVANRDAHSGKKSAEILAGAEDDESKMSVLQGRTYLRTLNIQYIGSNRDLGAYIKREKKFLLQEARAERTPEDEEKDIAVQETVKTRLKEINDDIKSLSYMQKATTGINTELSKLSFHHEDHEVVFEVGSYDSTLFIDDAHLASKVNNRYLAIGGDGRNNQIFLSLWASRNNMEEDTPTETVIFAIEEPEAHLHPHQQRKVAEYLSQSLNSQVLLTSHSPQIASKFAPSSIVKFHSRNFRTSAASNGCSLEVSSAFIDFGHRLDIISAEAFFADVVFLVEGQSEVLFYRALAEKLAIDLDRYNISVLMVDGVGFETYVKILLALEIDFVLRTDNDIFKIPRITPDQYRLAGIERSFGFLLARRGIKLSAPHSDDPEDAVIIRMIIELPLLRGFYNETFDALPPETKEVAQRFTEMLKEHYFYLANTDLEQDLIESPLRGYIENFTNSNDVADILKKMQKKKATFMYQFLLGYQASLLELEHHPLAEPLQACKRLAEARFRINE